MKNTMRCLGIIALTALIGFSFALTFTSCGDDSGSNTGGGNPFLGTWYGSGAISGSGATLVFTSNTFTLSVPGTSVNGTYTYSGNTATLTDRAGDSVRAVISGNTLTLTISGTNLTFSK